MPIRSTPYTGGRSARQRGEAKYKGIETRKYGARAQGKKMAANKRCRSVGMQRRRKKDGRDRVMRRTQGGTKQEEMGKSFLPGLSLVTRSFLLPSYFVQGREDQQENGIAWLGGRWARVD